MHSFLVFLVILIFGSLCYHVTGLLLRRLQDSLPALGMWCLITLANGWLFLRRLATRLEAVARGQQMERAKELRRTIRLPSNAQEWIEQARLLYAKESVRITLQVAVLYVLFALTSHLWLPYFTYANMSAAEATQLELYDQLEAHIQPCLWAGNPTDRLCFLHSYEVLDATLLVGIVGRDLVFKEHLPTNRTLDLLVDSDAATLYPLDFVVPANQAAQYSLRESAGLWSAWLSSTPTPPSEDSQETVLLRRYVNAETELVSLLMHLQQQEDISSAHPCICALFLNIVSNVSFLYDRLDQRWLVMANPTIYRNSNFAELVESSISYNARSLFYAKHKRWRSLVPLELIHYDSFVIEYTEPGSAWLREQAAEEGQRAVWPGNEKLRSAEFNTASLFYRLETEGDTLRKQVSVTGDDAVCFVYCQALTRGYTEKKKSHKSF